MANTSSEPPDFVGSPYASPSAFAMDPELLHGLAGDFSDPSRHDLDAWLENSEWADPWALFRILKSIDPRSWVKWGPWSNPSGRDVERLRSDNEEHYWREISIQWKLENAMRSIETHARENGVLLLGDIPLYVAHDSADMWHSKELFNIGPNGEPLERSGAPLIHSILLANSGATPHTHGQRTRNLATNGGRKGSRQLHAGHQGFA